MAEKVKIVDQNSQILQKFMGSGGKGNLLIYNDNRHNIIEGNISEASWQELLEAALDKAPKPRMKCIELEIIRIALRKFDTQGKRGEYLGFKRTAFVEKLKRVNGREQLLEVV